MALRAHLTLRVAQSTLDDLNRRAHHTGQPRSALAERYVYEGLQMDEHPGIHFVDGALGRRAKVLGSGLEVWEIIAVLRDNDDSIAETAAYLAIDEKVVRTAVDYYGSHRAEIDEFIQRILDIAEHEEAKWLRAREALA
jgi:uncharacterized protein (DUF433 family)